MPSKYIPGSFFQAGGIGQLTIGARFFTTLLAAGSQYWDVDSSITLAGNFRISIDFATTIGANQILLADDHTSTYYFNLPAGTGVFEVWVANTKYTYSFGAATPDDGKLHNIEYVLTVTSLELFLDGVTLGAQTITPYTGANNFRVGNSNSVSNPWTGVIANVKIIDAGVPIHFWPISNADPSTSPDTIGSNDLTGTNLSSSDAEIFFKSGIDWLGVELVTQAVWENPDSAGGEWAFVNNQWVLTGSGALSVLRLIAISSQPDTFRFRGNVAAISGELAITSLNTETVLTTGIYDFIANMTDDGNQVFKRDSGVVNATLDKPSLKRILEGV